MASENWVGKCPKCDCFRAQKHTIINRMTNEYFCLFDGQKLMMPCNCKKEQDCERCGGTGLMPA